MKLRTTLALLAASAGLAAVPGSASAQSLKIALSSEPTSADPTITSKRRTTRSRCTSTAR